MVRRCLLLVGVGMLTAGCGSANEPAAVDALAIDAVAIAATSAEDVPDAQSAAPAAAAETVTFEPPFPNRTELFDPPRGGQGTVRRDDEHGESVELKGFVNVNGPQVVLAIDGVLLPIPEGGEKYGVQVISINPPQVVLQRGRSRWTASLE